MTPDSSPRLCVLYCIVFYIFTIYFQSPRLVLGLVFGRVDHELRPDVLVEVRLADDLELERSLLEREVVLVCVFGGLAGGVVADDGVEAGNEHETALS